MKPTLYARCLRHLANRPLPPPNSVPDDVAADLVRCRRARPTIRRWIRRRHPPLYMVHTRYTRNYWFTHEPRRITRQTEVQRVLYGIPYRWGMWMTSRFYGLPTNGWSRPWIRHGDGTIVRKRWWSYISRIIVHAH